MLADGGEVIADLALLRDQAEVFGPVASTPTAWHLLAGIDSAALARLRSARATAPDVAWLQAAETTAGIPPARAGGRDLPGRVLDLDATMVTCHAEKEQAGRPTSAASAGVFGPRSSRLTQPEQALGSPTGCRERYNGLADVRAYGQKTGIRTLD
ncbi:hypothetical protein [Streptomyces sp. NPDC101166]|uniref:hypothetical protein n=1 Tax=Streptomyces sp. NPDC101166 TaxID=3366120 RepID=UPI00382941B3